MPTRPWCPARSTLAVLLILGALAPRAASAQRPELEVLAFPDQLPLLCRRLPNAPADSPGGRPAALSLEFHANERFDQRTVTVRFDSLGRVLHLDDVSDVLGPAGVSTITRATIDFDPALGSATGTRGRLGPEELRRLRAQATDSAAARAYAETWAPLGATDIDQARRLASLLYRIRCGRGTGPNGAGPTAVGDAARRSRTVL